MKFNTYLSFSVACYMTIDQCQVDALNVQMLDSFPDCAPSQIFDLSEAHVDLAQTARSQSEETKAERKRKADLQEAKSTLARLQEEKAKLTPEAKQAMPFEQKVLDFIAKQEADAEIEDLEGGKWEHPDLAGFVETIIGGFFEGFGIAAEYGAGRDQEARTKEMVGESLELQKVKSKEEASNALVDGTAQAAHMEVDRILAQTVTSAELGADAQHVVVTFPLATAVAHFICMWSGYQWGNAYINLRAQQAEAGHKEGWMSYVRDLITNKSSSKTKVVPENNAGVEEMSISQTHSSHDMADNSVSLSRASTFAQTWAQQLVDAQLSSSEIQDLDMDHLDLAQATTQGSDRQRDKEVELTQPVTYKHTMADSVMYLLFIIVTIVGCSGVALAITNPFAPKPLVRNQLQTEK